MSKKFLRGLGYFFCAILIILCILMIIATASFGSRKTVEVFGYNVYVVETDGFESAPKGCAVLVKNRPAMELKQGNLVLWNNDGQPALGYIGEITLFDGVYSFNLDENGKQYIAAESQIIGHAEFSSIFWGRVITFIKTPIGVFCIAVLPCIALILFDIIRAAAKSQPEPEVEPLFKNIPEKRSVGQQYGAQNRTIGVNSDGKAAYKRSTTSNSASADSVLFEPRRSVNSQKTNIGALPKTNPVNPKSTAEPKDYPKTVKSAAVGAYSRVSENKKPDPLVTASVKDKTAEITVIPGRGTNDAFFAQTAATTGRHKRSAPQIGKPAGESERAGESSAKTSSGAVSGRKSSQILATKSIDDLISDDDDRRSMSRISNDVVDNILADITGKDNNDIF